MGIVYTASDASRAIGASGGSNSQSHDQKASSHWWRKGAEDDDSEETWGNWGKDQEHDRGVKRRHDDTR